jgi:hypothetical protein
MPLDKPGAAQKANLIAHAYDMFQEGVPRPPVSAKIAADGYDFLYYLNATDLDSTVQFYGYIAKSTTQAGAYTIVIRGTQTPSEWLADFTAVPVPFSAAPDAGTVALGFDLIYSTFVFIDTAGARHTLAEVIAALAGSPGGITSLLVLGHSLGAALATLACAELCVNNLSNVRSAVQVYTFASPLVGLLDFVASFDQAVPSAFRIWNTLDIVPYVPPFPYLHVSGFGDGIVQSEQELQALMYTPNCEHNIASYQWLLDPANHPLATRCTQVPIHLSAALEAHSTAAARSGSIHRMAKAMSGHA